MHLPPLHDRLERLVFDPILAWGQVESRLQRAIAARLAGVVVHPVHAKRASALLRGTGTGLAVMIGPLGTSKPTVKAIEATAAVKDGADEVVVTPYLPNVIAGDLAAMKAELLEIVRGARAARPTIRITVAIELTYLLEAASDDERSHCLSRAGQATLESGGDAVHLGLGSSNFQPELVRALKRPMPGLIVKAAPPSDSTSRMGELIAAGVDRLVVQDPNAFA